MYSKHCIGLLNTWKCFCFQMLPAAQIGSNVKHCAVKMSKLFWNAAKFVRACWLIWCHIKQICNQYIESGFSLWLALGENIHVFSDFSYKRKDNKVDMELVLPSDGHLLPCIRINPSHLKNLYLRICIFIFIWICICPVSAYSSRLN